MKTLNDIVADLIRDGEVTLNISGVDPEELISAINRETFEVIQKMNAVLDLPDLSDSEKVLMLRSYLED